MLTHLDDVVHLKRTRILNAKGNRVKNLNCADGDAVLPYCGVMDLSENHLESVGKLNFPALKYVNLRGNVIRSMGVCGGHANLEKIDLSGNALSSLAGLSNFPKLTTLNVSNNRTFFFTCYVKVFKTFDSTIFTSGHDNYCVQKQKSHQ